MGSKAEESEAMEHHLFLPAFDTCDAESETIRHSQHTHAGRFKSITPARLGGCCQYIARQLPSSSHCSCLLLTPLCPLAARTTGGPASNTSSTRRHWRYHRSRNDLLKFLRSRAYDILLAHGKEPLRPTPATPSPLSKWPWPA